jgi:hypothetical protein
MGRMMVEVAQCRPQPFNRHRFLCVAISRMCLNLSSGRKFAGVGLRQTAFYLVDLPSVRLDERLELIDPRA